MQRKKEDRLSELCERALSATDLDELLILFRQINKILVKHILQVERVVERAEKLPPPQIAPLM